MEPCSVIIFLMISPYPDIELKMRKKNTDEFETFSALQQFPESKLESIVMFPKLKVLWEGGMG